MLFEKLSVRGFRFLIGNDLQFQTSTKKFFYLMKASTPYISGGVLGCPPSVPPSLPPSLSPSLHFPLPLPLLPEDEGKDAD